MEKFSARNENFGKTIFNNNNYDYFFIDDLEFKKFKKESKVKEKDNIPFAKEKRILFSPIRVYFDITTACNLRCKTCLNSSGNSLEDELSTEESIETIEGFGKDNVFYVKFSGGEPTQRKDWVELIKTAKDVGLIIGMNTNAIYSKETLNDMLKLDIDEISVSLDGFREQNDYIRGKGSFDKASMSIKELYSAGKKITINSVVTKKTKESDLRDLINFASKYCEDISFFHPRPIGRAKNIIDIIPNFYELNEIMKNVDKIKKDYGNFKIKSRSENLRKDLINLSSSDTKLMVGGPDGFTRFNIMSDGKLFAGGCVPYVSDSLDMSLGNIRDENFSLLNIWRNSSKLWDIRNLSSKLQKRCNSCSSYNVDCSGFTLEMELYKKVYGNNPFCRWL